jgi:subtilisin family serine protease
MTVVLPGAASATVVPTGGTRPSAVLDLVKLRPLMARSGGRPNVVVGLIDGPIDSNHPDLLVAKMRHVAGGPLATCARTRSEACTHGTLIAGILCARRGSVAPAICPDCELLVRPIFNETTRAGEHLPTATPAELAAAISDCIDAGADVLNLSAGLAQPSTRIERDLHDVLDYAMRRGALVVVAAGNQGTLGSSAITRHPWVVPVAACDRAGRPLGHSNLGNSIGRRGVLAPGEGVTSLAVGGGQLTAGGTSVAVAFVTGTAALLWSLFPTAKAADIKQALTQGPVRRTTVVPPLLDAERAYQFLAMTRREMR